MNLKDVGMMPLFIFSLFAFVILPFTLAGQMSINPEAPYFNSFDLRFMFINGAIIGVVALSFGQWIGEKLTEWRKRKKK